MINQSPRAQLLPVLRSMIKTQSLLYGGLCDDDAAGSRRIELRIVAGINKSKGRKKFDLFPSEKPSER